MNIPMLLCAVVDGKPEDVNKMLMVSTNHPSFVQHAHLNTAPPVVARFDIDVRNVDFNTEVIRLNHVEFEGILVGRVGKCSCGQIVYSLPR